MSKTEERCPVCGLQGAEVSDYDAADVLTVGCKRCGRYRVTAEAHGLLPGSAPDPDLSGVLRNHNEKNPRVLLSIRTDNYEVLKSSAPAKTDVPGKVRFLLRYIARHSTRPGSKVHLDRTNDCSVCFAADADELNYYSRYAEDVGYILGQRNSWTADVTLTPAGWEEAVRTPTLDSPNAFVAMCLSTDVPRAALIERAFREAIEPAIEKDAGYHAIKINDEPFNTDIVFEIIARIKESRFVVADVTEQRNGVYYEAGFAMGMGLPVIWMCHEEDMKMKKCHFDTSHLNHIVWTDDLAKLRKDLANRILATIGKGPNPPA